MDPQHSSRHRSLICNLLLSLLATTQSSASSLYSTYHFNPLQHMPGLSPYFEPFDPIASPDVPQGCTPVRAAYITRHAAIYANSFDFQRFMEPFALKLANHTSINWSTVPTLNFLADWTMPISESEVELLTRVGKLEATKLGVELSFRYPNFTMPRQVWASAGGQTVDTARAFVRGLETNDNSVDVISVPVQGTSGANNLEPYLNCPAYSSTAGRVQSSVHQAKVTKPIAARLNSLAAGFNFTGDDVWAMMDLCAYESIIRGSSPFCKLELFSPDDWLAFEYTEDLWYHYNTGYGSPVAGAVGMPWLRATANLLLGEGTGTEDLYTSFVQRDFPPMVAVAMGLFNNSQFGGAPANINDTMPLDRINYRRAWKSSHILPFLGNIAIERLSCTGSYGYEDGDYYRVMVSNSPQPLSVCADGPGTTCSRKGFENYLHERVDLFNGFSVQCGITHANSTDNLAIYTDT